MEEKQVNYMEVPNIISCKDLDYLSDMFNWNYGVYKSTYNAISNVNDEEIKEILVKSSNIFRDTLSTVLNIINGGINNE